VPNNSIDLSKYRLSKAAETYAAALNSASINDFATANNRAYYSLFHSIRAVLALDRKDAKKHSAVIGSFNKDYIHSGTFDKKFSKIINDAFEIRGESDYEDFFIVDKQETLSLIASAKEFYDAVEIYLNARYSETDS
jgi:uncharacterized protein (UPF0332 family)